MTYATGEQPGLLSNAELVYRKLRAFLLSGQCKVGDRLTEMQLTERFGVSRTPVREALRRLQSEGLVARGDRGVVVSALLPSQVRNAYQLRAALEALSAELAAGRQRAGELAPSQLDELDEARAEVDRLARQGDIAGTTRANLRLHQCIASLAGNELVEEALGRIWDKITISSLTNLADSAWRKDVSRHHAALVAAIRSGSPDDAAAVAKRHVLAAADVYAAHPAKETGEPANP